MIQLLNIFDSLVKKLKELKRISKIDKFLIDIDQRNTINVLVVTDLPILKDEFSDFDFNFVHLTFSELDEDFFYNQMFIDRGDEIIEYKNSRRKLTNFLDPNSSYSPQIPIVTYYSYKGGMGRSTNLVLTTTHLARHYKKRIVIIDCDFEAPGFSNFFTENPASPRNQNGLIEYFFDSEIDSAINLNNYSWEVSKEYSDDGEIRIIPAGNLSIENALGNDEFNTDLKHYLEGLSRLDFSSTEYMISKFEVLISDITKQFNPDAIFIDSRTGFTDIFGITALKLATHVVGLFSNSVQNLPGIYQFIDSIKEIPERKKEFRALIVNAFSDADFFEEFKEDVNSHILRNTPDDTTFLFTPEYFYFRYNTTLSEIGTSREKKRNWLEQVDSKEFGKGYVDLAEKLNSFINEYYGESRTNEVVSTEADATESNTINNDSIEQESILSKLKKEGNWPELYAEDSHINYEEEISKGTFFFRESMKDIFNFHKFLVLGNKGTGKSYLFQALKKSSVVDKLKEQAQKKNLKIQFLHLVDKTNKYFISTEHLEGVSEISDFYNKFWKVYTWKAIIDQIGNVIKFESSVQSSFKILYNDTSSMKDIVSFISVTDNIIKIEKELIEIDKILNSEQIDIIAIYDNLDLMVAPINWKNQVAPLINFWDYANFKRIHSKLFIRTDLYIRIVGLNNSQSLVNKTISIEWRKEEIFNYFFNLVRVYAKEEFINVVERYNFESQSEDSTAWKVKFFRDFKQNKQKDFDEYTLRRLCWVFFGRYPDVKAHGESYDWLYKNVMNADETISLRPFIELLKLSIDKYFSDADKDRTVILSKIYYTDKSVRKGAVENHFNDLIKEKGNENLRYIFDYIDNHSDYQYFEFSQKEFTSLLSNVKSEYQLNESTKELEELLIINGIVRKIHTGGGLKYTFAFLYKYRLGLGNRKNKK